MSPDSDLVAPARAAGVGASLIWIYPGSTLGNLDLEFGCAAAVEGVWVCVCVWLQPWKLIF